MYPVSVDTAKEKVNKLTKENPVVFWGGVNNVSKNNSAKGLCEKKSAD
jgi:hypothetical protein